MRQREMNFCNWFTLFMLVIPLTTGCVGGTAKDPPAPGMKRFTNSRSGLLGSLAQYYIDFSFDYPQGWDLAPRKASDTWFVGVARLGENDKVLEEFGVGNWYTSRPVTSEEARSSWQWMMTEFSRQMPDYRKVSEGPTTMAGLSGHEIRFTCTAPRLGKSFGCVVFQAGDSRGVTFTVFASELDPQFQSVHDVGVKGEMPKILNTFKTAR